MCLSAFSSRCFRLSCCESECAFFTKLASLLQTAFIFWFFLYFLFNSFLFCVLLLFCSLSVCICLMCLFLFLIPLLFVTFPFFPLFILRIFLQYFVFFCVCPILYLFQILCGIWVDQSDAGGLWFFALTHSDTVGVNISEDIAAIIPFPWSQSQPPLLQSQFVCHVWWRVQSM